MNFRTRLALVAAAAVALAVVLASAIIYVVVRSDLRGPVDDLLRARAAHIRAMPPDDVHRELFGPDLGNVGIFPQIVLANGTVITPRYAPASLRLPVTKSVLGVANGHPRSSMSDSTISGTHVRTITFQYEAGTAIELATSLTTVDRSLSHIRLVLIVIAIGGVAFAAALGLLVSRAALTPVRRLTRATEKVRETGDLSERIEAIGQDELSRLAGSFNTMLGALEESTRLQRQLVTDASHELRTPLTSLRTNIEVLAGEKELAPKDRKKLLADVIEQLGEMTTLIAEVVELARGDRLQEEESQDVRLDLLTADAVERMQRYRPGVRFATDLRESLVRGVPSRLERAIGNLLDNAAKWSPAKGEVEVAVRDGEVVVRDHGPGIDEEDLPHVFDRFYRARTARGMAGSGLGLAIVRQVAEAHGGTVVAERAEGGGTRMTLRLNGARPDNS